MYPFIVHMYSKKSMQVFCLEADHCILHIDATGSVVKRLCTELSSKPIYYYAAVIDSNISVPVAEMLSNSHDTITITLF